MLQMDNQLIKMHMIFGSQVYPELARLNRLKMAILGTTSMKQDYIWHIN
jgi:hypothetical protein